MGKLIDRLDGSYSSGGRIFYINDKFYYDEFLNLYTTWLSISESSYISSYVDKHINNNRRTQKKKAHNHWNWEKRE